MDQFILEALEGDFLWYQNAPVLMNQTAFLPYTDQLGTPLRSGSNSTNMNKRMAQFLKRSWPTSPMAPRIEAGEINDNGNEKGFRHMINERMRREKQRQSYLALHSLLPNGTKSDKNWIVQMATTNIQDLERHREELRKRNMELEAILGRERSVKWSKIILKVANPTSAVDSMLEVLKCLQRLGIKTRNIQSSLTAHEFSTQVEIETKIGAAVVETAIQETLYEVERKLLSLFQEGKRDRRAS